MIRNYLEKHIASKVNRYEQERFKATCLLHETLNMYNKCILEINVWPWWVYAHMKPGHSRYCRLLLKMIYGHTGLGCHTARFSNDSNLCKICDDCAPENVCHMLFCCNALQFLKGCNYGVLWKMRHLQH